MGDWFQVIVDEDATLDEARDLATTVINRLVKDGIVEAEISDCTLSDDIRGHEPGRNFGEAVNGADELLRTLRTNGLETIVGRTVFDSGQGGFDLVCSMCKARIQSDTADRDWSSAIQQWYDGAGEGMFACPNCGNTKPITEWTFDPPWGFGNLGFLFWNWPPLKDSFVEGMGDLLKHRVVLVAGKL
jgi:hypothetical protein